MINNIYIPLNRSVIGISGEDSTKLLQGIISNDIEKVTEKKAIYTFQLTPQGKYLFDFFISLKDGQYLIDIAERQRDEFLKKLKMYKLRSKVEIIDLSTQMEVVSLIGDKVFQKIGEDEDSGSVHEFCKGHAFLDPRSNLMYARAIIGRDNNYQAFQSQEFMLAEVKEYNKLRIENNIPEGEFDLVQDKSYPLQFKMINLNAVDFKKGCYVGQEVTARTYHRGVVRKQVFSLACDSKITHEGNFDIIISEKRVGNFLSKLENNCLALLDVDFATSNKSFEFEGHKYTIRP